MAKKVAVSKESSPKSAAKSANKKTTAPKAVSKKSAPTKAVKSEQTSVEGGTKESPWSLKTPSGQSEYQAYRAPTLDPPALVVIVGKTELRYHLRCIDDLHKMLKKRGDWMTLGSADEQKPAKDDTVEYWARSADNPVQGWYGIKKGLRGRFANYVPPVLKLLGLAEVEDKPKDNRMRAI